MKYEFKIHIYFFLNLGSDTIGTVVYSQTLISLLKFKAIFQTGYSVKLKKNNKIKKKTLFLLTSSHSSK